MLKKDTFINNLVGKKKRQKKTTNSNSTVRNCKNNRAYEARCVPEQK